MKITSPNATERVFAAELNRSYLSIEQGEPPVTGALTPLGGWCRRIFFVGALTEVIRTEGQVQRARLSDPTGTIDLTFRPQNLPPADLLLTVVPPVFLALTGSIRSYGKNVVVQPDMLQLVDRQARDAWVLFTAQRTLQRMEAMKRALSGETLDACVAAALHHYGTSLEDLHTLAVIVQKVLMTVPPERKDPKIDPLIVVKEILAGQTTTVEVSWLLERAME
ncbi:MAG: hypothetical protein LUO93_01030, partial [Methanomicrobiales archaeon]|nr:hypothetical protein [Methanomicrobiales archaeon]MDD1677753.1 hypothetical protein [Methanomicrobiales archaeon]